MRIGTRMKQYERVNNTKLMRRTPVMIRLDGRAFHTFTRGFKKPFDKVFIIVMQEVARELCENISNAKIAYIQSDEISILMTDWDKLETEPFFDNKIQKLASITASMATSLFITKWFEVTGTVVNINFDSRLFNLPESEVVNYFIWRQLDWTRNSIQMVAQSKYSQKKLQGKSCNELQEMLFTDHNINWNDFSTVEKRGTCIIKEDIKFVLDCDIPIFPRDRNYITKQYEVKEEELIDVYKYNHGDRILAFTIKKDEIDGKFYTQEESEDGRTD